MENQAKLVHQQGTKEFEFTAGDISQLLNINELKALSVHGKPLLASQEEIERFIELSGGAVTSLEELGHFLESQLSEEDAVEIYRQQIHRKIVGKEFNISTVGDLSEVATETLVTIVPNIQMKTIIIEDALESIEYDSIDSYLTFVPSGTPEEEEREPIRVVTGNTLRSFLNTMQMEEGGFDLNQQILVYCHLLTNLPDDDPTKLLALTQMRSAMVYGDVVSNKNLRYSLTRLLEEE